MTADGRRRLWQGGFAGALLGLLLSQYAPVYGSPQQRSAEPWTPLRKTLAGHHMLPLALLGVAIGYGVARAREE